MNDAWETQYSTALSVWPVFSILIYHHLHEELPEVLESFAQRVTKQSIVLDTNQKILLPYLIILETRE